jgi:hypothetical protein
MRIKVSLRTPGSHVTFRVLFDCAAPCLGVGPGLSWSPDGSHLLFTYQHEHPDAAAGLLTDGLTLGAETCQRPRRRFSARGSGSVRSG